jgi:2,4-dienoyl-CoA reductase (NADPH2)
VIELHCAHGYLAHSFLSPLSNRREDSYGGSLENRMRFVLETAEKIRAILPSTMPFFVRISATDWVENGWDLGQSVSLSHELKRLGVDLIDVSSGGIAAHAKIPVGPGYQVSFAAAIRRECRIPTGAVGKIEDPRQANEIVASGAADVTLLGRQLLREPYFAFRAQAELGAEVQWPLAYGWALLRKKP